MSGAAGESILLSTAIAKVGNEERVLRGYAASGGRLKIENLIFGRAQGRLQAEYRGLSSLMKYWRDEAGHGGASSINDNEAFGSLALLLRLSTFMNDNWDELIKENS